MNSYIFSFIVLLGCGGAPENQQSDTALSEYVPTEIVKTISYDSIRGSEEIKLQIKPLKEKQFLLEVTKVLSKGNCLLGSPHHDRPIGFFDLILEENRQLSLDDSPYDIPKTLEEVNPAANHPSSEYNRTVKIQKLITVTTNESFEMNGVVKFVTEHEYVMEEISFTVSYKNGSMNIIKAITNE